MTIGVSQGNSHENSSNNFAKQAKKIFSKQSSTLSDSDASLSTAVNSQLLESTPLIKDQPKLISQNLYKFPEVVRYFIAGIIGNGILFIFNEMFYYGNPIDWQKETVAWVLSVLTQTPIQYILFELLVYGKQKSRIKGIISVYVTYSLSVIVGAIITYILVNQFEMTNNQSWVITLIVTSFMNYALISNFLKNPFEAEQEDSSSENEQDIESNNRRCNLGDQYFQNVEIPEVTTQKKPFTVETASDNEQEQEDENGEQIKEQPVEKKEQEQQEQQQEQVKEQQQQTQIQQDHHLLDIHE